MGQPLRLAMWSGPRNISTAMMRSFGSRADTVVCDEPLYAHYLASTSVDHPGRDEIVAHGEADWRRVAAALTGPVPGAAAVFYQKHMAHHLLPHVERGWLEALEHAFLIRDPREMLLSLARVTPDPTLEDTGLPQQLELFESVRARTGRTPPVIDARDVLEDPQGLLRRLCAAVGLAFDPAMLRWEPGPRPTDGIWARHWYAEVERSTGFAPWRAREGRPEGALADVLEQCQEPYRTLHRQRLLA
jgi:hypothetical protein